MTINEADKIIEELNALKKKTYVSIWNCLKDTSEVLADYYSDTEHNRALDKAIEVVRTHIE